MLEPLLGINMKINRNNFKRAAQDSVLEPLLGINMKINRNNFKRAIKPTLLSFSTWCQCLQTPKPNIH